MLFNRTTKYTKTAGHRTIPCMAGLSSNSYLLTFLTVFMMYMLPLSQNSVCQAWSAGFAIETRHSYTHDHQHDTGAGWLEFSYRLPKKTEIIGDIITCTLRVPDGILLGKDFTWTERIVPLRWHRRIIRIRYVGEVRQPLILEIIAHTPTGALRGRERVDLSNWSTYKEPIRDERRTRISDILADPHGYSGKTVMVSIRFGSSDHSWQAGPQVTRSDGPVHDESGAIWMIRRGDRGGRISEAGHLTRCKVLITEDAIPYLVVDR